MTCSNLPTHRILFSNTNTILQKCKDCFSDFQIISKGHENEFIVEEIKN